jgi:hypothetical protein
LDVRLTLSRDKEFVDGKKILAKVASNGDSMLAILTNLMRDNFT